MESAVQRGHRHHGDLGGAEGLGRGQQRAQEQEALRAAGTSSRNLPLFLTQRVFCVRQVYIVAVERSRREDGGHLLDLVRSDLPSLGLLWLEVLRDYALLSLGQEEAPQLAAAGETDSSCGDAGMFASSWASHRSCSSPRRFLLHGRDGGSGQSSLLLRLGPHPARHLPVAPCQRSALLLLLLLYFLVLLSLPLLPHGLVSAGFVVSDDTPAHLSRPATPTSMGHTSYVGGAKSPEDINSERLHLILGEEGLFLWAQQAGALSQVCLLSVQPVVSQGSAWNSSALHTLRTRWRTSFRVCGPCGRCWTCPGPGPGSAWTRWVAGEDG